MLIPIHDLGGACPAIQASGRDPDETCPLSAGSASKVQVIDLDAAMAAATTSRSCGKSRRAYRVGGGICTTSAHDAVGRRAAIIAGSSLFGNGQPTFLRGTLATPRPRAHIAAGQQRHASFTAEDELPLTAATCALEPFCGEFLYTRRRGRLWAARMSRRFAPSGPRPRRLTAAGVSPNARSTTDALGIDAWSGWPSPAAEPRTGTEPEPVVQPPCEVSLTAFSLIAPAVLAAADE